ncbi:hypothetical protein DMENIID0001_069820 [Sergentomyia squamirostris]
MSSPVDHFSLIDYLLFMVVFFVSLSIGLYYSRKVKGRETINEYLFAGNQMKILPVSCSLVATAISGSLIIGFSMEVYAYGLHSCMYLILCPFLGLAVHYIFLPIFYELKLMSTFMYLEMRFDKSMRYFASGLYYFQGFLIISLSIYVPAFLFQEVTGINFYVVAIVAGLLCTWYTAIGGIRAVMWTDVFQSVLIFVSTIIILTVGIIAVSGVYNVWEALKRGQRLSIFKTELNLEQRGSIWAYIFSTSLMMMFQGISQSSVQRFCSLPSLAKAKTAMWIQVIAFHVFLFLQLCGGATIYAIYETCDPLTSGAVRKLDQIYAHFVQEKASLFTGFNGIFIAGLFAGGLSTASTVFNTMSGTIYVDFFSERMEGSSEVKKSRTVKILVFIIGILGISMIFLIERLGTVFVIMIQIMSICTVATFGFFINGILIPRVNSKGAKCGAIVSILTIGILMFGSLGKKPDPMLPLRIDGCEYLNKSIPIEPQAFSSSIDDPSSDIPWIFRINFQFYCIIGLIMNISVSYIVSAITGWNVVEDQRLLAPFLRKKTVTGENLLN